MNFTHHRSHNIHAFFLHKSNHQLYYKRIYMAHTWNMKNNSIRRCHLDSLHIHRISLHKLFLINQDYFDQQINFFRLGIKYFLSIYFTEEILICRFTTV